MCRGDLSRSRPISRLLKMLVVLGLLVWLSATARGSDAAAVPTASINGNGRCNTPPCTCDQHERLTCNCSKEAAGEELILTAEGERGLSRHTSWIVVTDCSSVVLTNHSLAQMDGLISVDFVNVANLTLTRHSFKLSPKAASVRLTLRNSSLDSLPSNVFHGDVEAIVLDNVRIGRLAAFAFANLVNTNIITLEDCQIEDVEALAFKKFEVSFLHVIGGSLGAREVPSRAIIDVEVREKFMLDGVRMGTVRSSAFVVKQPRTVTILRCDIDSLESEAFDVGARGTVLIKNNTFGHVAFGAFLSIRAVEEQQRPSGTLHSLIFKSNNLTSFEEGSLVFDRSSFRTELSNVLVNQACDCDSLALWRGQILNYTNVHSRLVPSRENSASVLVPSFALESTAEDPESFLCLEEPETGLTASFVDYEARNCVLSGSFVILVSALCGLVALLVVAGCLVVYCCRRRRRDSQKRWISVPTSAPDVVSKTKNGLIKRDGATGPAHGAPVDSRITMVVPDGRLYRETEFHVIVEKAEPLTTEL